MTRGGNRIPADPERAERAADALRTALDVPGCCICDLCHIAGASYHSIVAWLRGERLPSAEAVEGIEKGLAEPVTMERLANVRRARRSPALRELHEWKQRDPSLNITGLARRAGIPKTTLWAWLNGGFTAPTNLMRILRAAHEGRLVPRPVFEEPAQRWSPEPLRDWMERNGVTVTGAAKMLRVPPQSVSHWLTGRHVPLPWRREQIAELISEDLPNEETQP